jgi:glucosylceramidase
VTTQNEPTSSLITPNSFNCLEFTAETQAIFVEENLGPTLQQNGYQDVKIMIFDDQRLLLPIWAERVLKHSEKTRNYIAGIAVHWYLDNLVPPDFLDITHSAFPDKFLLGTEACTGKQLAKKFTISRL